MVASASERWFLYIVRCADGTLYTGIARDVAARIAAHEAGRGARYTRGRGPLTLLVVRRCATKGDALRLELAVKALSHVEKERLVVGRRLAAFARKVEIERAFTDKRSAYRPKSRRRSTRRARPPDRAGSSPNRP